MAIGEWNQFQDGVLDPEAYAVLAPDDVLNRTYRDASAANDLSLFIAYYKTQLRAKNAHDPKVCLCDWEGIRSSAWRVERVHASSALSGDC